MKNYNIILLQFFLILQILKEFFSYNKTHKFNFSKIPQFCYREDFELTHDYRPFIDDIYPIRGCSSDDRNKIYQESIKLIVGTPKIVNVTFEPKLDYFFNKDVYPPQNRDPPTSMTFKIVQFGQHFLEEQQGLKFYVETIFFSRFKDYYPIPKFSKKTGKPIEYYEDYAMMNAKIKVVELQNYESRPGFNLSYLDYDIEDYEGTDLIVYFNRYEIDFSGFMRYFKNFKFYKYQKYAIILKVYDLPRMKMLGLFQFAYLYVNLTNTELFSRAHTNQFYTVDTRNVFFQNISMFYNQRVNVTDDGLEPTGEDSGFWVKTPCNTIQMATIMVDYHFFDTIHRMQSYGYVFDDRFQLRIHTPFYRKTLTSNYSLFRSQWNDTYPEPRVFIHPISKYKEHCDKYKNCTKFNYEKWSTDPEFTQYIRDVKCEIVSNEIRINFTELEEIYKADGFHRGKLVINVNNTMTPHITHITNGLWAELVDLVTNDYVMKTKTVMDETHGYIDDYEPDPYRNFYLTCEIPDNITADDVELYIKKFDILRTAHLWFKLDVFNKGVTKLYPPRFNVVFKFPPEITVTNETFMLTYMYYKRYNDFYQDTFWILKDLESDGIGDGKITNATFDYRRNIINVSELHPNTPIGDDHDFWTQTYLYLLRPYSYNKRYFTIQFRRQFVYYFYDLETQYTKNNTGPVDITVYYVRYVPHHTKNQINRGLHRWNQHHAGWHIPDKVYHVDRIYKNYTYNYYYEPEDAQYVWRSANYSRYINVIGPTNHTSYGGKDCVFDMSGGSTLRNKSCEYWAGIIPELPFTNYARDIIEEHIAYRTINDNTFVFNTSIITKVPLGKLYLDCVTPGRKTAMIVKLGLEYYQDDRWYIDGEYNCMEFSIHNPRDCLNLKKRNINHTYFYSVNSNINKNPQEFFTRVDLPESLIIHDNFVGRLQPCLKKNYTLFSAKNRTYPYYYGEYYSYDHMCYYMNSSTFYAFNSLDGIGQQNFDGIIRHFDVTFYADGFYNLENKPSIQHYSFDIHWGFFEDYFYEIKVPEKNNENFTFYYRESTTLINSTYSIENTKTDFSTFLYITTIYKNFYEDSLIVFYFDGVVDLYVWLDKSTFNGKKGYHSRVNRLSRASYDFDPWEEKYLNYSPPQFNYMGFLYYSYYLPLQNESPVMKGNGTVNVTTCFDIINGRSLKPITVNGFITDIEYRCIFDTFHFTINTTIPKYFYNMTVEPNSYFTSDRAIYNITLLINLSQLYPDDILEFKTSWKTKYFNNIEDPNDKGYYINRITFGIDRYKPYYLRYLVNYLVNPETFDTQYIKDFRIYDKENYLIGLCNETVAIKMRKVSEFKRTEVHTEKTDDDNKFDISFEATPEILIKKNDTLNIKFSSIVSLKDYPECKIESSKGLNIESPDFKYEINVDNNEIILYNAFKDIGENVSIFDNLTALALKDQEFKFKLKDIPIYSNTNDLENIFSIELKTETDGKTTQKNLLPSTAIFKCDSRCKTCNEQAPSECLTCIDKYPIYYPIEKYCHNFCPKEKYYQRENENGIVECINCEEPCENCLGLATNCTLCSDGYFMENNTCVKNCKEGNEKDYILRVCYPKTQMNKTVLVERDVYVNVSVPDPNNLIERNICMINQN